MSEAGPTLIVRRARAAALLGVALVAFTELLFVLWDALRPALQPSQAPELQAAAAPLLRGALLAAAPNDLALPLFGLLGPTARSAAAFVDPARFDQALELSAGRASDQALSDWSVTQDTSIGPVRVRSLRNPSPLPLRYDLVAHLAPGDVQVSQGPAGGAGVPCGSLNASEADLPAGSAWPWAPRTRFSCGSDPRAFVAQVVLSDAKGIARRCIWTFPTTNAVRLAWPKVPAGAGVRGGLAVVPFASGNTRARLLIRANGAVLADRIVNQDSTFDSFDLPAPMLSHGGELALELEQRSDNLSAICLEASVR